MSYIVSWDGPSATDPNRGYEIVVNTVAEADAAIDRVVAQTETEGIPFAAQIHRADAEGSLMVGLGHGSRAFVDWLMDAGHRQTAIEPGVEPQDEPIGFDVYGQWHERDPEETMVTPPTARRAIREYVNSGQRPTGLTWTTPALPSATSCPR